MTTYLPLFVAVLGLLTYALTQGKAAEAGRLTFFAGALVTLFQLTGRVIHL